MAIPKLSERIINAANKLYIDPDDIVSVMNLSKVKKNYATFYVAFYDCTLHNCLMVEYRKFFHINHCFVCDNGFVVEYVEDELYPDPKFPNHYNIYNIMVLYSMGYTQKDIAKALNTSVSTIGNRIKIIKQILEISDIDDLDPEDTIKIEYGIYTHPRLSEISNRLQAIIDKYERRKNDGKNVDND